MKILISLIATILYALDSNGQVALTSVVEHFTNTSCGVCASNNGTIYNAINNHPNVLHISFHPSSPYPSDFFNQQNMVENDARTYFYNIYGGTPQTVMNGTPIFYTTLNGALNNVTSLTSNFAISISQTEISPAYYEARTVIKKVAADTLISASLFVGVLEDTIYQLTNNGENVHYNVFRKSLSSVAGDIITLPVQVGDSVVLNYNFVSAANWSGNHLHTIGILQRTSKVLINSVKSTNSTTLATSIDKIKKPNRENIFYPNPVVSNLIYSNTEVMELNIYNQAGAIVANMKNLKANDRLMIDKLESGSYLFVANTKEGLNFQKIIK